MIDYTLEFTVPVTDSDMGYNADTGDSVTVCTGEQGRPLTGVSKVRLYTYERNPYRPVLHHEKPIEVLPGETDTVHVSLEQPTLLYITTLDDAGNESCASNGITVGPAVTGVEPEPIPAPEPEKKRSPWVLLAALGVLVLIWLLISREDQ